MELLLEFRAHRLFESLRILSRHLNGLVSRGRLVRRLHLNGHVQSSFAPTTIILQVSLNIGRSHQYLDAPNVVVSSRIEHRARLGSRDSGSREVGGAK